MAREPTAAFPANVAIVRAQASGYSNRSSGCYGVGSFCVVTVRDVESEEDFQRLLDLPMIAGVAPMNRILLPVQLQSLRDLRTAAAQLKTDMLLVYSFDTRFRVETDDVGPLQTIALGFLPTREAQVSTTASAALFDVRTGFLYGVAEATAREEQRASMWSTESAVDSARERTETESFKLLVTEFRNSGSRSLRPTP